VPGCGQGSTPTFTGVPLALVLPAGTTPLDIDVYEIHHGFFHTRRLHASDLEPGTALLAADQREQKSIDKASLFYVVATTRDHKPIINGKVTAIVVHPVHR
jgi:hypothetical protein